MSPFIKTVALDRLLTSLGDDVGLKCITRWRPAEVAAGVSDLAVFGLLNERGGALWLRQDPPAMYFRGDERGLVGSPNLPGGGLGWSPDPNLELLVEVDRNAEGVGEFEQVAQHGAVVVDQDLYEMFSVAAKEWVTPGSAEEFALLPILESAEMYPHRWLPASRHPGDLFAVYQAPTSDDLPTATRDAGRRDLSVLQPPAGLSEAAFDRAIGATLLSMPVVNLIDRRVVAPQRFGAIRDLLKEHLDLTHDEASRTWQTLIRWLRHFLPGRYKYTRPRHSEIISRARVRD
ncbi:MAG: hypothetical protein F4187_00900 [Gemmatimonadetes bacterium]|nr:hypothetical protein [Gemmatimonadota bacterium]